MRKATGLRELVLHLSCCKTASTSSTLETVKPGGGFPGGGARRLSGCGATLSGGLARTQTVERSCAFIAPEMSAS